VATNPGRARLTEIGTGYPEFCRRDNAVDFDDYDAEVHAYDGTTANLWGADTHVMYWGSASKFESMGIRIASAPSIGAITWEYSDGAAGWVAFDGDNPLYDGSQAFLNDGMVIWEDPPGLSAWGENTVDSQEAYWIRASIASHAGTGTFYNFLHNMTLREPVKVQYAELPVGMAADVNSNLIKLDLAYTGITGLNLGGWAKTLIHEDGKGYPNVWRLWYWRRHRREIYFEDLALDSPVDPTVNAIWKNATGRIVHISPELSSPYKMMPRNWALAMHIEDCTEIVA